MKKSNEQWERIGVVMDEMRYRNVVDFARALGLKRPQNLYNIKSGVHGISRALAKRICHLHPQYTVDWLFYGNEQESPNFVDGKIYLKNDMLIPLPRLELSNSIPCVVAVNEEDALFFPRSMCRDTAYVAVNDTDILYPHIRKGDLLFLGKPMSWPEEFDRVYYVVAYGRVFVRLVRRCVESDKMLLTTYQSDLYEDIPLGKENVGSLYPVRAVYSALR